MKLLDLGVRDGPLLLFGGPYSNLQATRAVLEWAAEQGLAADHMICTGDVVAYCGAPAQTVAAICASNCVVVAGNCEKQLAAGAMDCGCGFETGSACDLLSAGWFAHADAHINKVDRAWMDGLPDMVIFRHHGARVAVIHGGATGVNRFLWPVSPKQEFKEEIEEMQRVAGHFDIVIAGHCGLAFERMVGNVRWINAGVIGMPPNDGTAKTQFALLKDGRATIHSLEYDAKAAQAEMIVAGLTQGYHEALVSGYWPSEDVLPPELRRAALASG